MFKASLGGIGSRISIFLLSRLKSTTVNGHWP